MGTRLKPFRGQAITSGSITSRGFISLVAMEHLCRPTLTGTEEVSFGSNTIWHDKALVSTLEALDIVRNSHPAIFLKGAERTQAMLLPIKPIVIPIPCISPENAVIHVAAAMKM